MAKSAGNSIFHAAILGLLAQAAFAQDTSSPDYKAGYEAGYKAAMEALKASTPSSVSAQAAAIAPAASATRTSATGEPSDWWNHSALIYRNLVPAWRHHAEVQFTGSDLTGNDSGFSLRGSGKVFSRSNRWSNELIPSLDKRKITQQPDNAINQRDYRMLQDSLRYDLSPKFYTAAGFIIERDDVNYIDRRNTVLAGLGYYVLDNPSVRLNVFLGLGRLHETYLEPVPSLIGIDRRNSGLIYLYQTFDWRLSQNWSLQQGFRQIRDLDEFGRYVPATSGPTPYVAAEMLKRYRNVSNVSLNYQLSPRSTISLGIESRFDSNPWPDVKPRDTTRRLSINMMY